MRTKKSFVPSSLGGMDRLEDRVVLSHGPTFVHGAAVLTTHAYAKASGQIKAAFVHFAHGQDMNRLNADLTKAVSSIPYHKANGLDDSMSGVASQLQSDISSQVTKPVITAYQSAISSLHDSVQSGIDDGSIVIKK